MAKISARGARALFSLIVEDRYRDSEFGDSPIYRFTYTLATDGRVLQKVQVRDDGPFGRGGWYGGSYRVYLRCTRGVSTLAVQAILRKLMAKHEQCYGPVRVRMGVAR